MTTDQRWQNPNRMKRGEPWKLVCALIREHGCVTPDMYLKARGFRSYKHAKDALWVFVRDGRLETDRLGDGALAFFLAVPMEQAS